MISPSQLTSEQLTYNEETRLHGVGTVQGQVQRRMVGMGYGGAAGAAGLADHIDTINQAPKEIFSQIKVIMTDTFKATYKVIAPSRDKDVFSFEIFGFDFMLDD
jgi:hypothetical protein